MFKTISPTQLQEALAAAEQSPMSAPYVSYPHWYLHRWHFLPEGYLSRRGISGYEIAIRRLYYALQERQVIERVAQALRGATNVLELACGPGRALAHFRHTFPEAAMTGLDLSPFMLERARTRLPVDVALLHGDSRALPVPDAQFDAVVALHHLGHVPRDEAWKVLREAKRVLRPGGKLVLVEHRWHPLPRLGLENRRETKMAGGLLRLIAGHTGTTPERQPNG